MADVHDVFAHLRADNGPTYRAVLTAFTAARRRFAMHLRPADVAGLIRRGGGAPPDDLALANALEQLCTWGNLRSHPDTGRVTSPEDFYRARHLYQLTHEGEAAERALAVFDDALGRRGALQTVALADISAHLHSLQELTAQEEPDPAKAHLALDALSARFAALADNAEAFMGSLQRSIDLQDVDVEAFVAYKNRLVEYLERFISDLLTTGATIAALILALDGAPITRLVALAVDREVSDLPEDVLGLHPQEERSARAHQVDLLRTAWEERWDGVRTWFLSRPGHPAHAAVLRAQARSAVPALLQVVSTLNERRQGRSDRAADFRALAVRFATAADDDARHRLWHASFGLGSVRHLSIDADTLEAREDEPVAASTGWQQAPPLLISPQLRRTGSWERRGRPTAVRDRAEERRHLAARLAAESAQTSSAREQLLSDGPRPLSQLPRLDPAAFALFLSLLGTALAAARPGGGRTVVTTGDGSLAVELEPLPGGPWVSVATGQGTLSGPDHLLWVREALA